MTSAANSISAGLAGFMSSAGIGSAASGPGAIASPYPLVRLNVRMPAPALIDCMPCSMRIVPGALERRAREVAAGGRSDLRGEWWLLQSEINRVHDSSSARDLRLFYRDAKAAFESGRKKMRGDGDPASACADFLSSAVLFAVSGERSVMLARAFQEAAASAGEARRPAASAIIYEKAFLTGSRLRDAASAASGWLESIIQDREEATLGFRIGRGLLFAELAESDEIRSDILSIS